MRQPTPVNRVLLPGLDFGSTTSSALIGQRLAEARISADEPFRGGVIITGLAILEHRAAGNRLESLLKKQAS